MSVETKPEGACEDVRVSEQDMTGLVEGQEGRVEKERGTDMCDEVTRGPAMGPSARRTVRVLSYYIHIYIYIYIYSYSRPAAPCVSCSAADVDAGAAACAAAAASAARGSESGADSTVEMKTIRSSWP